MMQLEKNTVNVYWPKFDWSLYSWLPSKGNVVFTLLAIGCLIWTQNAGATLLGAPAVQTTSTETIPYQGRLADASGDPLTDTVDMSFQLYNTASGGAPLWTEQWVGSSAVQVSDGLFNVMLGSLSLIDPSVMTDNNNLFLGVTVATDDEMTPRVQIGSVPLAVHALTVPNGSITSEKLADGAVTAEKLDSSATFHLLAEKTCDDSCASILEENLEDGWHDIKGDSDDELISVTVTTNGGNLLLTMSTRYQTNIATGRHCGIYVYQDGQQVRRLLIDGDYYGLHKDWSCSGSMLVTDLPAGTYEFRARA
ncbi:MAG: hypothetical protein AAF639_16705 [Chloroflexota bacterium]